MEHMHLPEVLDRAICEEWDLETYLLSCFKLTMRGALIPELDGPPELSTSVLDLSREIRWNEMELGRVSSFLPGQRTRYASAFQFEEKGRLRAKVEERADAKQRLQALQAAVNNWQPPVGEIGSELKDKALSLVRVGLSQLAAPCLYEEVLAAVSAPTLEEMFQWRVDTLECDLEIARREMTNYEEQAEAGNAFLVVLRESFGESAEALR